MPRADVNSPRSAVPRLPPTRRFTHRGVVQSKKKGRPSCAREEVAASMRMPMYAIESIRGSAIPKRHVLAVLHLHLLFISSREFRPQQEVIVLGRHDESWPLKGSLSGLLPGCSLGRWAEEPTMEQHWGAPLDPASEFVASRRRERFNWIQCASQVPVDEGAPPNRSARSSQSLFYGARWSQGGHIEHPGIGPGWKPSYPGRSLGS